MANIIVQATPSRGKSARVTLSERVAAVNLQSWHYTAQLIERVIRATADADAVIEGFASRFSRPVSAPPVAENGCATTVLEDAAADRPQANRSWSDREDQSGSEGAGVGADIGAPGSVG
jgi:hypothetical protein